MKSSLVSTVKTLRALFPYAPLLLLVLINSCSVAEPRTTANADTKSAANAKANSAADPKSAAIDIEPNGPADTVRAFYKHLRDKKFREAIFLTNLRPAVEGLTDAELKDFSLDFEAIAGQVPPVVEINGEIVTGELATVTANLPSNDSDKNEIQKINLRRDNGIWIILTVDEAAEKRIKAEGKQYFYNLRIETHEEEAKKMLERISKAELVYSLQNGGNCTEIATLIGADLLPDDVTGSATTGYNFAVTLLPGNKQYFATATPAEYGKSGRQSFLLQLDGKGVSHVTGKDTGGKPMKK